MYNADGPTYKLWLHCYSSTTKTPEQKQRWVAEMARAAARTTRFHVTNIHTWITDNDPNAAVVAGKPRALEFTDNPPLIATD